MTDYKAIFGKGSMLPMKLNFGKWSLQGEIHVFKEYIYDNSFSIKQFQ